MLKTPPKKHEPLGKRAKTDLGAASLLEKKRTEPRRQDRRA
jgi:hypothetical protein